jgi:hypothetical protein
MAWVVFVLLISIVVGAARGGRLHNLLDVEARAWWLLIVGLGMQAIAVLLPASSSSIAVPLLLASYLPILMMVAINRNAPGMWIAGIGILMNSIVIALNAGMPVLPASVEIAGGDPTAALGGRHVLLDQATRLPFLGDIIPLPGTVISMGDVFLAIGLGVFAEEQMRIRPRLFRHGVPGEAGSAAER